MLQCHTLSQKNKQKNQPNKEGGKKKKKKNLTNTACDNFSNPLSKKKTKKNQPKKQGGKKKKKKKKSKQTSRRKVGRGSSQAGPEKGWQKGINVRKDLPNDPGRREAALLRESQV